MPGETVRLATTQWAYRETPPEAMPYSDVFSLEAARGWSREMIDGNAGLLAKAGAAGADLVVCGEDIAHLSYAMTYLDDTSIFRTLAAETAAYAHQVLSEVARKNRMHVVACFFEPEGEETFNSAVLFGREGQVMGRYHKVHLPVYESWQVTAGDSFSAFETDIGVVGMLICYDDMWPESTAATALKGARIICHPSAASPQEYRVRTRAMDAQVFYITSTHSWSRIVSPNATVLADAGEGRDVVVTAEANVETASLAPENYWEYLYSGIRDHRERHLRLRRPEAYSVLVEKDPPALEAYPRRRVANDPAAVREIYEKQKEDYRRGLRGEKQYYVWKWSMEGK
jgi:predicted amidohydrolase